MSVAEPAVGVFALRTFRVSVNGYLVPASQYSDEWATGTAIARCGKDHQAPDDDCTCGLYSMRDLHQLTTQYKAARGLLAVVALEGQTIQGTKGWRSQAARVVDVWTAPRAVPAAQLELLRAHLPGVRFHTDAHGMLAQYPALVPDPRPRRTTLAVGACGTWDRVRAYRVTRGRVMLWSALTAALVGVLALISTPRITAGLWVELATIALAGLALAVVAAELPGQLIVLAVRGGTMPLVLATWGPVKHLWRVGSSVLAAGLIAGVVLHQPARLTGTAVSVAAWLLLLGCETFLCAMHRTTRPTTLPVLIGWRPRNAASVRTGWEPAQPTGRRRVGRLLDPKPFRGSGVAPIIITTTRQGD